jgi:hypothetical protein
MYLIKKYKVHIEIILIASILLYIFTVTIRQYFFENKIYSEIQGITGQMYYIPTTFFIFFLLGNIIASNKSQILSIKKTTLLFFTVLAGGLSYIEYHELTIASVKGVIMWINIYYMLPILTSLIFILCIAFPNIRVFEFFHLPELGKRYALYIYLIHGFYILALQGQIRAFNWLFRQIDSKFNIQLLSWLTTPTVKHEIFIWLLISLLSLLTAVIVEKIVKLCSPLFHKIF